MTAANPPIIQGYETARLRIQHWGEILADPSARRSLEAALTDVLTPPVLAPLPPSMQLSGSDPDISAWVADRATESDTLTIRQTSDDALVGLLILAQSPAAGEISTVHLGYLLGESYWGMGYATEVVTGLIHAAQTAESIQLSAGVALDNPASAKVLINAGFTRAAAFATPDTDVYHWP